MSALAALILLSWLAYRVGIDAIARELEMAELDLVLAATLLLAIDGIAKAWNWRQLLTANVDDQPVFFGRVLSWFFAGGVIGSVVPSSAGTDACRVVLAARSLEGHGPACTASIVTLNAMGLLSGSLMGLIGLGVLFVDGQMPVLLHSAGLIFLGIVTALLLAYATLVEKRWRMITFVERVGKRWPAILHMFAKFVDALLVFEKAHMRLPAFLLVSAIGLLAQTGMFALTARAVGIDLPFAVWLVMVPLTRLVNLVPMSVAGFGLMQAAHVSVLSLFGVSPWQSFSMSALWAIEWLIILATLGSSALLFGIGREERQSAARGRAMDSRRPLSAGDWGR